MVAGDLTGSIVKILGVAGSITTAISLAALSMLIAFLLVRQWIGGRRSAIERAIDRSDDRALARYLGGISVPLDELSAEQKLLLATEDLRTRFRQQVLAYSLIFFSFLALLVFGGIVIFFDGDRKPIQNTSSESSDSSPAGDTLADEIYSDGIQLPGLNISYGQPWKIIGMSLDPKQFRNVKYDDLAVAGEYKI